MSAISVDSDPLLQALHRQKYPTIYAQLRRLSAPLSPERARMACSLALRCTGKALEQVLNHCPPLPSFQFAPPGRSGEDLVLQAIRLHEPEKLDILLRRGASFEKGPYSFNSPLEEALESGSVLCLSRLLEEPALDCTLTDTILKLWAMVGSDPENESTRDSFREMCLREAAPRLLGRPLSLFDPIPVPDQLTVAHAAFAMNIPLLIRLLEERAQDQEDQNAILSMLDNRASRYDMDGDVPLLVRLLEKFPDLLPTHRLRRLLAAHVLLDEPESLEPLLPWLDGMEPGQVTVPMFVRLRIDPKVMLDRWEALMPPGVLPLISRGEPLHSTFSPLSEDVRPLLQEPHATETYRRMFSLCRFTGSPLQGKLSGFARLALHCADLPLLERLLLPGELLDGEDFSLLLKAVPDLPPAARMAVLSAAHKVPDYSL